MDISSHKKDFTLLRENPDLVYLDSAASSLTPDSVVAAMDEYYYTYRANIARGVYTLSERATEAYEDVRKGVARFIGAQDPTEVIFTSGTTMSLNIIAHGLLGHPMSNGRGTSDVHVAVTAMEHHANFIPWQEHCKVTGAKLNIINVTADGHIDKDDFQKKVTADTAILAFTYVSNVLGTINPIKDLIAVAKARNPHIITVVDAAQAAPHLRIDVHDLGCDFLAFSAHKMCGPTGVGVLWGTKEKLELLTPLMTGGEMIEEVTSKKTTFAPLPHRLEAGTPNIAGVIGLGHAIAYLEEIGMDAIRMHEQELGTYAQKHLRNAFGDAITLFGPTHAAERSGVISFVFNKYHPHDIASILDSETHVCVRAGNHCAMPLHVETLGVGATTRASFYLYNDTADIDRFIKGLSEIQNILG